MKNMLVILLLSMSLSAPVLAINFEPGRVCVHVANDNKRLFNKVLKKNNMVLRKIHKDIKCNGKTLLEFADSRGSLDTGTYIISRLPKSKVKKTVLENVTLQEAQERRLK